MERNEVLVRYLIGYLSVLCHILVFWLTPYDHFEPCRRSVLRFLWHKLTLIFASIVTWLSVRFVTHMRIMLPRHNWIRDPYVLMPMDRLNDKIIMFGLTMVRFSIRQLFGGIVVFLHSFTWHIETYSFDRLRFVVVGITSWPIMTVLASAAFKKFNPSMNGYVVPMTNIST